MEYGWLIDNNVMSKSNLDRLIHVERKIKKVRRGHYNETALVDYNTIPPKFKAKIIEKLGANPFDLIKKDSPVRKIVTDYKAFVYYTDYRYPDGSPIPTKTQDNILLWANNACILNALRFDLERHAMARAAQGRKPLIAQFYRNAVDFIKDETVISQFEHNLPANPRRLKSKLEAYIKHGYESLVKNNKGNVNARKINYKLKRLICFIATMPTRPYNTRIIEIYSEFMGGDIELVDGKTGEILNREDYMKSGKVVTFTEARAWQIVNENKNQIQINKKRMGWKDFDEKHRPHRHRTLPEFSFSKISLDDRDLIWRDDVNKTRPKAYYAYDVTSGCRVGSSYSRKKDATLFLDCLRDMFVFIDRNGFGIPMEVEVENHLVNEFFDDLKAMFPYLTICAPANSKEKRAEHFNRAVKYQIEKKNRPGIGRWWLKSAYNRMPVDKVDDEFKQTLKPFDRMVAEDIQDTIEYNNALHKNQRKYPGMSRLDVLRANLNPNLPKFSKSHIYKYIGYETKKIKIYNTQYLKVQYDEYVLPHPSVVERLKPNNLVVDAYWMPDENGDINEVYLYQEGEYICTANKLIAYNEAKAERTDKDVAAKLDQDKYVAQFDKYSKDETWAKLEIIRNDVNDIEDADAVEVHTPKQKPDEFDDGEFETNAINNF